MVVTQGTFGFTLDAGQSLTFTGTGTAASDGAGPLSARAVFSHTGSALQIVLTNTGPAALVPADAMTALFWNSSTLLSVTNATAILTAGSTILNDSTPPAGGNVGRAFDYSTTGFNDAPAGTNQGIGTAGLCCFSVNGNNGNFGGPDLSPSEDNQHYNIVNGVNPNTPNSKFAGRALISNSVTFTFSKMFNGNPLPSRINLSNVYFQFSTSMSGPRFGGGCTGCAIGDVPEPSFYGLMSLGLGGLGFLARRRMRLRAK